MGKPLLYGRSAHQGGHKLVTWQVVLRCSLGLITLGCEEVDSISVVVFAGFLPSFMLLESVLDLIDSHEETWVSSGFPSIP